MKPGPWPNGNCVPKSDSSCVNLGVCAHSPISRHSLRRASRVFCACCHESLILKHPPQVKENLCGTCTKLSGGFRLESKDGLRFGGKSFDDNMIGKGSMQVCASDHASAAFSYKL